MRYTHTKGIENLMNTSKAGLSQYALLGRDYLSLCGHYYSKIGIVH